MKKLLLVAAAMFLSAGVACAQGEAMSLKGVVIDNMCANAHKATLGDFVKTHTKECAIAPGCIDSGYSLYSDGKLYKFDTDSSNKVAAFLKKDGSQLKVAVTGKDTDKGFELASIANQE